MIVLLKYRLGQTNRKTKQNKKYMVFFFFFSDLFLPIKTYRRKDPIRIQSVFLSISLRFLKLYGSGHTFWVNAQEMLHHYLGKFHCLGGETRGVALVYAKAKMHFHISTMHTRSGRAGKSLFTLKMVPCYIEFSIFLSGQVIQMLSPCKYLFKNLLRATACQHYVVLSLNNRWDTQVPAL